MKIEEGGMGRWIAGGTGRSRLLLPSRSSGEEKSATSSRLDIRWLVELKRGRRLSNSNFNNSAPYACNFNGATRLLLNYASIPGHLSTYQPQDWSTEIVSSLNFIFNFARIEI